MKSKDDIFYEIIAHLNDKGMHGNQGLWQTEAGLIWIWETPDGWRHQYFGEARRWPA